MVSYNNYSFSAYPYIVFYFKYFSKIFKTIICLGFTISLWSQNITISGTIIDGNSKTPIHGANIYIEEMGIGTTSKVDGSFELNNFPSKKTSITISMIGFKETKKVVAPNEDGYDIGIVEILKAPIKIKEVLVDAHSQLKPEEFSSNIYISGSKLQENLKSTLAMTLEQETGVFVQSMGQAVAKPVLRGYTGDRFLLTENGITTGDLSNTAIDHAISFDMASFNNVRIIRGPEALLYGCNTIGGVIDVSRQSSLDLRFKKVSLLSLIGVKSSNNGAFGNFTIYLPISDNHQLKFSLLRRSADNQTTPVGVLDNTGLSNEELSASYSFFGKSHLTTISYEQLSMDYGLPGSPEGHINGVNLKMDKSSQKLTHHRDISFFGFETFDFDQRFINYNHSEFESSSIFDDPSVSMGQNLFSLQGKLAGEQLTIGSLFQYRDFRAGGFYWTPDTEEIRFSIFGLFQKKINETTLQFSSRLEHLSIVPETSFLFMSNLDESNIRNRNFTILSGSIGLFKTWNNFDLSLATMISGRAPDLDELYSDGPHLGTYSYEIGQPNLNLERTFGIEGSIDYSMPIGEIKLTGYHNYSPNYHISTALGNTYEPGADWIEWGSGSIGWLYKYQMKGLEAQIYGWESDIIFPINKTINIIGSTSVVRGKNLSQGRNLEYMPPDKIQLLTEFDFKHFDISFTAKKVFAQTKLGEFETRTEGFSLFDLNGSYTIHSTRISHKLIFQVDNIFDEVYYNHLSRIKSIMPEEGRCLSIQYRLIF